MIQPIKNIFVEKCKTPYLPSFVSISTQCRLRGQNREAKYRSTSRSARHNHRQSKGVLSPGESAIDRIEVEDMA